MKAGSDDAIKEQHDFGTLAQSCKADHQGERRHRALSGAYRPAYRGHGGGHLLTMARHPQIVPHQHDHSDAEYAGIEKLLAGPVESAAERFRKCRQQGRAQHAQCNPSGNPVAATRYAAGDGKHDADDQAGFDDLTKHDNEGAQHPSYSAITTPLAVSAWNSPTNS